MSAQITILAALQAAPREKSFMVAGMHTSNIWGRIQTAPFEFRVLRPDMLKGAVPGEMLLIQARIQPLDDLKGQLLLLPTTIDRLGGTQATLTERGYTCTTGIQRVMVSGNLAANPETEDFGKGMYATKFALELHPTNKNALLDVMVYGESAQALGARRQGDRYTATGHLIGERNTDPLGRDATRFTFLPDRADVEDAESFERRTTNAKNRANKKSSQDTRRNQAPGQPKPQGDQQSHRNSGTPPKAGQIQTVTPGIAQDVAALTAPGPKERRPRTAPATPFTASAQTQAPDPANGPADQPNTATETLDLTAVAGSMTANLDDILKPTDQTTAAEPAPATN